MKISRSEKQKRVLRSLWSAKMRKGVRKFAFFPVKLEDVGYWIWLDFYWYQSLEFSSTKNYNPDRPPYEFHCGALYSRKELYENDNYAVKEDEVLALKAWILSKEASRKPW